MTEAIVVRMSEKEIAEIDALAKSRKTNRSAIVRQATRQFVLENRRKNGAGWPERLEELRQLDREFGRKLPTADIVEEIRSIDRNRW